MSEALSKVDHASIRTNQAVIIIVSLLAYIFNLTILVPLVALVMLIGTIIKKPGFGFLYTAIFKPLGWIKPDVIQDNPEPHRFAQGFGATVLIIATIELFFFNTIVGWSLVWLVIFLATLNLFVGFCAGCAVYYWFNRLKLPGFNKTPPAGVFPGFRPKQ
jgi:hypothetical protein